MSKKIYEAVANLPEELITPEIAQAAIQEGKIELLDSLPHKYLSGEVVMSIIERNSEGYSWRGFNLKNIPEGLRSREVCEFAIKKEKNNILHTPSEHISNEMLSAMMVGVERNLKYLHLFPESVWTIEDLVNGVSSIYSKTTQNSGPRGGYRNPITTTDLKPVAIFMSYVPNKLKSREFYLELFDSRLSIDDIDTLTPSRFKNKSYYLKVAQKRFSLVPESFYDYDTLLAGLRNNQISLSPHYPSSYYRNDSKDRAKSEQQEKIRELIFSVMDDTMADVAIEVNATYFKMLPTKFQTPKRLIFAIQNSERERIIHLEGNETLFTMDVCKAYIYRNKDLPTLPSTVWTPEFVDCCMGYGTNFQWFDQLPQQLQTPQMAEKAMNYSNSKAKYIRPELITLEMAQELYRDRNKECVPPHYLKDFYNETGLSEEFFGGEVAYDELRNNRKDKTFCHLGHSFIAFNDRSSYSCKDYMITLTRRTPASFRPIHIFDRCVQTFHATWLEKLIADNDAAFIKPSSPSKSDKEYQVNSYFKLDKLEVFDGVQIYANSLLGEMVYYTAKVDHMNFETSSVAEIKESIKRYKCKVAA